MRIGLIEVGHWHTGMYINALTILGEEIKAVSDRDKAIAKRVAEKINCSYYTDYREMLKKEDLDFVFSFGKHIEMPNIIETLIDQEISFNAEKPCGVNYKRVRDLAHKAYKKRLFASVSFVKRVSIKVREILDSLDRMGEIKYMYFKYITGSPSRYIKWNCPWMLNKKISGGGCLINLGVHYIDLINYLFHNNIEVVYPLILNKIYGLNVEDYSLLVLKTDKKYSVVEVGYTPCHKVEEYFSIIGTNGRIIFSDKKLVKCFDKRREILDVKEDEYFKFIEETIDRFKRGGKPIADLEDAAKVLEIVNKAYNMAVLS